MPNKRIRYIDQLKGISIIAIMLLHFEDGVFPRWVSIWIGGFMITAFYWSSGWLAGISDRDYDWGTWWKKRWRSLGVPYFVFSAIILLFDLLLMALGEMPMKIFLRDVYKTLVFRGIGTLWFLPALLGGEAIFRCFARGGCFRKALIFSLAFGMEIIYKWWRFRFGCSSDIGRMIDAPLRTVDNILQAWWVIAIGYYLAKRYFAEISLWRWWRQILCAAVVLCLYTLVLCRHRDAPYTAVLGPPGIMFLCMLLDKWRVFSVVFGFFGKNSLIIMATHFSILQEICICLNRHLTGSRQLTGWTAIYCFLICLVVEIPIIFMVNKYFPASVGKKRLS